MRRWSWLECSGRGFLVINQSAGQLFENEQRRCCYARSGPIVYAHLPISRTPVPQGWEIFHGSQWLVLAHQAVRYLLEDPKAISFANPKSNPTPTPNPNPNPNPRRQSPSRSTWR